MTSLLVESLEQFFRLFISIKVAWSEREFLKALKSIYRLFRLVRLIQIILEWLEFISKLFVMHIDLHLFVLGLESRPLIHVFNHGCCPCSDVNRQYILLIYLFVLLFLSVQHLVGKFSLVFVQPSILTQIVPVRSFVQHAQSLSSI